MRETGGRGQGPGRGGSGAGSQGGPGAVRRTPGGPGRSGRQGGAGRPSPDDPPRRNRPDDTDRRPRPDDADRRSRPDDAGRRDRPDDAGRPRQDDTERRKGRQARGDDPFDLPRGLTGAAAQESRRARAEDTVPQPRAGAQRRGPRPPQGPPQGPPRADSRRQGRRPPPPPRPPLVLRLGNPRRRINIGLIGMTFILSIFAGRLIQLQGLDSKIYQAKAADQRVISETIQAKRGSITDVNGHELAVTIEAREVAIDPSKVPAARRAHVAAVLAKELNKLPAEVTAKLARVTSRYELIARDVDPVVADRLLEQELPAVTTKKTYRRTYPAGDLAGTLIGFVGNDGTGLEGVEQMRNSVLAGRDGKQSVEQGRDGQRIPMTRSQRQAPVEGSDVRLTIDRDVQWAAQKAITAQVAASGALSGTVIVMDVKTAQIIAMANAPELDLNNWQKAGDTSYVNRAVSEVFEPGSTNKVITAAAAIEARAVTPQTTFRVADHIRCADQTLKDSHPHPTKVMTFKEIVETSSNVGTIHAARRVGDQGLYTMLRNFGFGSRPGLGLPGEEAGLLPNHTSWSGTQRCTVAYGQGVSVTALQTASVYQTIANGGVRIQPQIVAGTTGPNGRFVPSRPGKQTRVVSQATAGEIASMLEGAVSAEGTGTLAAIPGYRVAGKTGTANRYDQQLGRYNGYTASFVGFAPADKPELVVLAVVQKPAKDIYGGHIAAPVFKDVMTFAIKSRKIPPTGPSASPARIGAGQ
ncbi:cell division protein FtsI [Nonomuraea africana]|uniref:Cell division protein FtsI (Penicillin-binding protein 3) n=1 Tax=Nonomuraea africana TaxID=46171 RepID=A0ABR9KHE2_9ACTN|nr:penicillin-binding transpeptidase domain-containing protein [Nonomuraea africana]MBE1561424.1 cell division protein FtsI (penicillin-binding protein 3) [Nonomuraea africana]